MLERENLNSTIEFGRKMQRLLDDRDFKEVFIDGYLKADIDLIISNLAKRKPEERALLIEQLVSRANLKDYINGVISSAEQAMQLLAEMEFEEKGE